jgi:tetratricopeptide (TPR) repeat protein
MSQHTRLRTILAFVPLSMILCVCSGPARCQDSGDQGVMFRGDRAEIAVTVRGASGAVISTPASVRLYKDGIPINFSNTSSGRAFFIPSNFGDFTLVVEAAGYKSAQKDVSVTVAGMYEVDVYLQRELASNEVAGVPGGPTLAPEAQKVLNRGMEALRKGKLDEAEKELNKVARLAPANPNVLYIRGILYLMKRDWKKAESELQESNQIQPNQAPVLSALGMALCNEEKYEEAIPVLQKSLQLKPDATWETDWALAKAYYFHQQYDQALKMAEQAHTVTHGTNPQAELLLAQCLTAAGRFEDSAQVLREFLKKNGEGADAATARHWLDKLAADGKIRR